MDEPRFLLMASAGPRRWRGVQWPGIGRSFTRLEAEFVAEQTALTPRFLLPDSDRVEPLRAGDVMVTSAGATPWDLGEPLRHDLQAVLRAAAAAPSPEPLPPPDAGRLPIRIDAVHEIATQWLGAASRHVIEAVFDTLMFDLGGLRRDGDDPTLYLVPFTALDLR